MKVLHGLFFLAVWVMVGGHFAQSVHDNQLVAMMLEADKLRPPTRTVYSISPKTCYGEFGCFAKEPWGVLPEAPDSIDPKFLLYTNASEDAVKVYSYNSTVGDEDPQTQQSLTDESKKLVFLAHGFGGSGTVEWVQEIKNAKTTMYGDNVIVVDWATAARITTFYVGAAANSVLIGRIAANLCLKLVEKYNISLSNVEFVGFSLGAQVGGFFAKQIFEATGEKIWKLTALDCAAPLFEVNGIYPSKDHVRFLEAVHTAAGALLWRGKVGIGVNYGHVDYYPNGGIDQPGCRFLEFACSHNRAVEYYIEALANESHCRYQGFPCDSVQKANEGSCYPIMDARYFISMERSARRQAIIYIKTLDHKPFCIEGS